MHKNASQISRSCKCPHLHQEPFHSSDSHRCTGLFGSPSREGDLSTTLLLHADLRAGRSVLAGPWLCIIWALGRRRPLGGQDPDSHSAQGCIADLLGDLEQVCASAFRPGCHHPPFWSLLPTGLSFLHCFKECGRRKASSWRTKAHAPTAEPFCGKSLGATLERLKIACNYLSSPSIMQFS